MSIYAHCDNCGLATKDESVVATWYAVVGPGAVAGAEYGWGSPNHPNRKRNSSGG